MALAIPSTTDWTLKEGDRGAGVWALQRACNKFGIPTSEDAIFGPGTKASAKRLQEHLAVTADGIVGPQTQQAFGRLVTSTNEQSLGLPRRLLYSGIMYESACAFGAVNHNSPGGVDCGIVQRRVLEKDYQVDSVVKAAFDPVAQIAKVAADHLSSYKHFLDSPGVYTEQGAHRVAVLNHNYPILARDIGRYSIKNLPSYYKQQQSWVTAHGLKFPDGSPIRTPLEWGQRYALGNNTHQEPGQAVKLTEW